MRWNQFMMRGGLAAGLLLAFCTGTPAQGKKSLSALKTRAERTGYMETSRYEDVLEFLREAAAASPRIRLGSMGYSFEGRSLPLVVVGDVKDSSPAAVISSGKTRVYIQANIHAGEVEGKEAMQELLRSLASGEHAAWLESMVLLIAPIYNADGNEKVNLTNRPAQNGPIGGMGQRANAQNLDLNRDHMKLESPEARSLAQLLTRYDPHLSIDLHTTNGTRHAYQLTYEPPMNPNVDKGIIELLRGDLLPAVTRSIKQRDGWDFFYYGNLPWRGSNDDRGWYASDYLARYNHSYIGLRNRLAILSEAFAYLSFEDRIRVTRRFVEEILDYVHRNGEKIRKTVAAADRVSIVGKSLALRAKYLKSPEPVQILMGDVTEERNPYTGAVMLRRADVRKSETMPFYGTFEPTITERAPLFYLVPASIKKVVERLEAHGIRYSRLERPVTGKLERFKIESSNAAARSYQGHQERTITGSWQEAAADAAEMLVVPVDQPLGRLVFMLLEPRSEDSLAAWNVMDDVLDKKEFYPILRTFAELP
jgi:hypothetical protein